MERMRWFESRGPWLALMTERQDGDFGFGASGLAQAERLAAASAMDPRKWRLEALIFSAAETGRDSCVIRCPPLR